MCNKCSFTDWGPLFKFLFTYHPTIVIRPLIILLIVSIVRVQIDILHQFSASIWITHSLRTCPVNNISILAQVVCSVNLIRIVLCPITRQRIRSRRHCAQRQNAGEKRQSEQGAQ